MKKLPGLYVVPIVMLVFAACALFMSAGSALAGKTSKYGAYVVVEGTVTEVGARKLVVDGQQYPVSMFVRVFDRDEKGPEISMQTIVNIGRIDKARLYILGGKVEKIIVLQNI